MLQSQSICTWFRARGELDGGIPFVRNHPVHRRPANADGGGNRARGLAAGVHALCQLSFLLIERLGRPMCCPRARRASRAADRRSRPNSNSSSAKLERTPATMRPKEFDVSMPSRRERSTTPRSPSSRMVGKTSVPPCTLLDRRTKATERRRTDYSNWLEQTQTVTSDNERWREQ